MNARKEFEKIIFAFATEAAAVGGQEAVNRVEYGHRFHFEDTDAIRYLQKNAAQLSADTLSRITGNIDETIIAGVREGKPIREITEDIHKIFQDARGYEAERIARTEVARGVNNGAIAGYKSMGVTVAEVYANTGACPVCMGYHGDLVEVSRAQGMIPFHPNCYCFWIPRPDITSGNVDGWKGMGEMPYELLTALDITRAITRTSISPKGMEHIVAQMGHFPVIDELRLTIENATAGLVEPNGNIGLLMELRKNLWRYAPIKHTDDYGYIALTGHYIGPDQLGRKLEKAVKVYGI